MPNVSAFPSRDYSPPTVPPIPDIPTKTILDYLEAMGLSHELTEAERTQFVSTCQAYGLNPWKREVYATVYGEGSYRRFSVITGYETYLKRAERTGRLNGWSSRIEGMGADMRAIVTIHRKDWSEPLVHEVFFVEAVQKKKDGTPTAFWQKMPRFQCRKVCISQAFRLCFPDELGGLPFDASELPDAEALAPVPQAVLSVPIEAAPVAMTPSPVEPSNVQDEPAASSPEPEAAPPSTPDAIHGPNPERYAGEPSEALLARLESFLDDNHDSFTERHREWVLMKALSSRDRSGIVRMLGYAEKVVRNAGLPASA